MRLFGKSNKTDLRKSLQKRPENNADRNVLLRKIAGEFARGAITSEQKKELEEQAENKMTVKELSATVQMLTPVVTVVTAMAGIIATSTQPNREQIVSFLGADDAGNVEDQPEFPPTRVEEIPVQSDAGQEDGDDDCDDDDDDEDDD